MSYLNMKKSVFIISLLTAFLAVSCGNKGGNKSPKDNEPEDRTLTIVFADLGLDDKQESPTLLVDDVTLVADKGESQVTPKYFDNGESLRLYAKNTLKISTENNISTITFNYRSGYDELPVTADSGSFTNNVWKGENNEVTFTVGGTSEYNAVKSLVIEYKSNFVVDPSLTTTMFTFYAEEAGPLAELKKGDITITCQQGTGYYPPTIYHSTDSDDLRCYVGNSLTITGTNISKIIFTVSNKQAGKMEADVGDLYGLMWTGDSNSITFNITEGQRRIQKIAITHKAESRAHTVESVAQDLLEAIFYGETNYNQGITYENGEAYIERMSDEETLLAAATDGANRVSRVQYLLLLEDYGIQEDNWSDGTPGAFAYFYDVDYWDNGIMVEVGAYEDYGVIFVQYNVYLVID